MDHLNDTLILPAFLDYMKSFEQKICSSLFSCCRNDRVFFNRQQLEFTVFGWVIGQRAIPTDDVFAVNYYGLLRRTEGFFIFRDMVRQDQPGQVRFIECPVVNFSSVKIEDIAAINPKLVANFPLFKQHLLRLRGFK